MASDNSVTLSIIVINVKGKENLMPLIDSLLNSSFKDFEVIVIDDVEQKFEDKRIRLLKINEDKGIAFCRNLGIKNSVGKFILFLDNDTEVDHDTLEKFISYLIENPDSVVQLKLVRPNHVIDATGGLVDDLGYPIELNRDVEESKIDREIEVLYAKGAAMGMSRNTLNQIGLFDEIYFYGYEETDLCYRARKMGIKVIALPFGRVIHKEHGSFSKDNKGRETRLAHFLERGRLYFIFKNFDSMFLLKRVPRVLFYFFGSILKDIYGRKYHLAKTKIRAFAWFVSKFPSIIAERRNIKGVTVNEKELMKLRLIVRHGETVS